MIIYGLKLWSNNQDLFHAAASAYIKGDFDFIELYYNSKMPVTEMELAPLRGIPVTLHAPHDGNFHSFLLDEKDLSIWRDVLMLADLLGSPIIVVHASGIHTVETFFQQLKVIDDKRILIENGPGIEVEGMPMFGQKIDDLARIRGQKQFCFDFEKAVKAACYQRIQYKKYITEALVHLNPTYFHISGGDPESPVDEHCDLQSSMIDFGWIKSILLALPNKIRLVFETPKWDGIANDLNNMSYFRSL